MAIRPVDLQLAYMAAPQNAALLSNAQDGPQAAQQAAQASFAAEVTKREESIEEPLKAQGTKVTARDDREPGRQGAQDRRNRRDAPQGGVPESDAFGLGGDGEHLIDVTA